MLSDVDRQYQYTSISAVDKSVENRRQWSFLPRLGTLIFRHAQIQHNWKRYQRRYMKIVVYSCCSEPVEELTSDDFLWCTPIRWLGSLVVSASYLRLNGREFDPRPPHYRSVGTGMGDRLRAGITPRYVTSHSGQCSLLPNVEWEMSTGQSAMMRCGWGSIRG